MTKDVFEAIAAGGTIDSEDDDATVTVTREGRECDIDDDEGTFGARWQRASATFYTDTKLSWLRRIGVCNQTPTAAKRMTPMI